MFYSLQYFTSLGKMQFIYEISTRATVIQALGSGPQESKRVALIIYISMQEYSMNNKHETMSNFNDQSLFSPRTDTFFSAFQLYIFSGVSPRTTELYPRSRNAALHKNRLLFIYLSI